MAQQEFEKLYGYVNEVDDMLGKILGFCRTKTYMDPKVEQPLSDCVDDLGKVLDVLQVIEGKVTEKIAEVAETDLSVEGVIPSRSGPLQMRHCREFYMTGHCSRGRKCKYMHDPADILLVPCPAYEKYGACFEPVYCPFKHHLYQVHGN